MPSLTAKTKSIFSMDASPNFPSRKISRASNCIPRNESSLFLRILPVSVQPNHLSKGTFLRGVFRVIFGFGKNGRNFEINQTKASIGEAIGDIAGIGIVMAHAEFF